MGIGQSIMHTCIPYVLHDKSRPAAHCINSMNVVTLQMADLFHVLEIPLNKFSLFLLIIFFLFCIQQNPPRHAS